MLESSNCKPIDGFFSHSVYSVNCSPLNINTDPRDLPAATGLQVCCGAPPSSINSPDIKRTSSRGAVKNFSSRNNFIRDSLKDRKVAVQREKKPSFGLIDLDEGGTPSTIPTTRPISCEDKKLGPGAKSLVFSKKPDLGWLESAGSKQMKNHFLEKGKRRIAFDQMNQDVAARKKQVSPFLRNSLLDIRSSFKGERDSSLKRLSSFEGKGKPQSNRLFSNQELKRQSLGTISKERAGNSIFGKPPKVRSVCFPFQVDSGVKHRKPLLAGAKRHQKNAASKDTKDFSSSKIEAILGSEKENDVFQLVENLKKIPSIARSEPLKEASAPSSSAERLQAVDSYYRLVMELDNLGKQPLAASLSTFIGNMSRKMMDFYNRFPIGTELPDRKVQLPKREPKSSSDSRRKIYSSVRFGRDACANHGPACDDRRIRGAPGRGSGRPARGPEQGTFR